MSKNLLSRREAYPVKIIDFTMYCENFKSSAVTSFYEQPTVAGSTKLTNKCRKSTKIVLSGRIYDEESPMSFITYANNMTGTVSGISFEYRGVKFSKCSIQAYSVEDKGDDYIYASITLLTSEPALSYGGEQE